jgi:hypothetical protein
MGYSRGMFERFDRVPASEAGRFPIGPIQHRRRPFKKPLVIAPTIW